MADLHISPANGVGRPIAPIRFPQLDTGGEPFGAALGRAVGDVAAQQRQAEDAATAIATGQSEDMAQSVTSIEKANISFQFALQIRNKLLEAYQDVMRMPV